MSIQEFEKFLESEQEKKKKEPKIDWEGKKKLFIEKVEELYKQIENDYLKKYIESGKIEIKRKKVHIPEEHIGDYYIDKLIITIGDKKVILNPIGANIIGGYGRVDIEGEAGTIKLILVPEHRKRPMISIEIIASEEDEERIRKEREELAKRDQESRKVWKIATKPPKIQFIELNQESFIDALMEVISA